MDSHIFFAIFSFIIPFHLIVLHVDAIAIRGRVSSTSTCGSVTVICRGNGGLGKTGHARAGETRFQPIGCDCALVNKRCRPENSLCIGPGGDLTENIGNGSPKRGTCGCNTGYTANCTRQYCDASSSTTTTTGCTIAVGTVSVPSCQASFSNITGSSLTATGCTKPLQLLLLVTSSSSGDLTKYVGLDGNYLSVYATGVQPYSTITQTYAVTAVDAGGKISNQATFTATIEPIQGTVCTC